MNAPLRTQTTDDMDFGNGRRFRLRRILNPPRHPLADANKMAVAHSRRHGHSGDNRLPHTETPPPVKPPAIRPTHKQPKRRHPALPASAPHIIPKFKSPPDTAKLGRAVISLAAKLAENNTKPHHTTAATEPTPKENDHV
jgi:hypothetical protein